MFSIHGESARLCDNVSRRELLRVGGLSALGLSLPQLLQARDQLPPGVPPTDKSFGKAKNLVFLYLLGGPSQYETLDPKPNAPLEIRGPFKPIQTTVPGTQFCELLPRTAQLAHKLSVVRSISTDDNNHDSSGYQLLTGYKYLGPNSRTIQPTDWPCFESLVKMLKPSDTLPPLSTVTIPDVWRLNENVTPAGQSAGFLGSQWNPDVFVGEPWQQDYQVQGLQLSDLPPLRLRRRESFLKQVEGHFGTLERGDFVRNYDKFQTQAFELMTSTKARDAFAIDKEPESLKQRYGKTPWGQCLLLARRLIEADARLVHVNWPREPGDNAVDNPLWDTHAQNHDRMEDVLCPQFDVGFSAFINDLDERGLLAETLVVAIGEFGRTPKINANGGRDHWGPVFSFALAGAGIAAGQVYGASDANGAYPAKDRCSGGDLTATLFHLLGINPQSTFHDREGREHKLTLGAPLYKVMGTESALLGKELAACTADVARVPPWDSSPLLNVDFESSMPLRPLVGESRPKGWRASPLLSSDSDDAFGVKIVTDKSRSRSGAQHAVIGFGLGTRPTALTLENSSQAMLAQEVRNPFAGTYQLSVHLRGEASSSEFFETIFSKHFAVKLQFFQFTTPTKTPLERKDLGALTLSPKFSPADSTGAASYERHEFTKVFENPSPGGNFSFGLGLGVALLVEKTSPAPLPIMAGQFACIRVDDFQLEFIAKKRKDDVKV